MDKQYRVLLFYKYTTVEDPVEFADKHLAFCKEIGLKGRILVGKEGINGTCSGTIEQTDAYMEELRKDPRFADTVFKMDYEDGHAFKKMHVRPREQIVNLSLEDDINPNELTGRYLEPTEFYAKMQEENTVIIDARNDYEYDVGHFRGAVRPDIRTFRELPQWIKENREIFEGKQVLAYCTGGIRCEKFTGWMLREGFDNVNHLHGGIVTYGKDPEVQGQLWDGQCYVFDERLVVPVNRVNPTIVGKDHYDGTPCERYVNCANPECNEQILCSEENEHLHMRGCTDECMTHPRNRYVEEHEMTEEQIAERLKQLEEHRAVVAS